MLKLQILRKDKDFKAVFSKGKFVGDKYVVMFFLKNGENYNRVACIASKKVGNEIGRAPSELQSPSNIVCRLLLEKKK